MFLITRSIGQSVSLALTIIMATALSCAAALAAYFVLFDIPIPAWDQLPDLSPTQFLVLFIIVFPLALAGGIFGGMTLWLRCFRLLAKETSPAPDRFTDAEVERIARELGPPNSSRQQTLNLFRWFGLIASIFAIVYAFY